MKKKIVQLAAVFLVAALTIGSVYGAFLTYKAYVEIYGYKYPMGMVEIDIKMMEPIEGLEAREDYIGEIRVWTYSNDTQLILQLLQVSHIVYNFRSFTVKVCLPLDIIFVVDEGDMGLYIATVKEQLTELVDSLPLMNKMPVRFGVVGFRDFVGETRQLFLTDDYTAVKAFIESLTATADGPSPQSHYLGLQAALNDFNANSELSTDKLLVFVTDAPAGMANAPSFEEAKMVAHALAERGIKIHAVLCGLDQYPENSQLRYYADVSIGKYIGPEGQHRIRAGFTSNPTWIVKLTPVTPFDSFRFKLNSSAPCEQEGFYTLGVYVDFWAAAGRYHDLFIVELAAHLEKAEMPPPPKNPCDPPASDFFYVGRDITTQGDWIGSGYGDCGYALPYAEVKKKQVITGTTTGIGESAHEFWWREPWGVPGEKYYPYEDYLGGAYILEYEIAGSEGPPRALVDADSDYYRPSWYSHGSSVTLTLSGIVGDFNVSVYLLDWDYGMRTVQVNVTSGGEWDAVNLGWFAGGMIDNFAAGAYVVFEVHSDGVIEIEVLNLKPGHPEWSAVIAGIFLDELSSPVTGVNYLEVDRETKGNWRPSYGNDYYLLPGFNVPASGVCYTPIDKADDETNIPLGNYDVSDGVCQFAGDDARTYGEYPYIGQYAAYTWTLPFDKTASDPRVLVYPEDRLFHGYPPPLNERIYGQWDSGELNGLLNHFTVKLKIPEGFYLLSVYAMDFGRAGRSETIEIWDEPMTTLLDSQHITADEINNGIYVQWFVTGPMTINMKVIADPGNLNSFIDGIFLNCVSCPCCLPKP